MLHPMDMKAGISMRISHLDPSLVPGQLVDFLHHRTDEPDSLLHLIPLPRSPPREYHAPLRSLPSFSFQSLTLFSFSAPEIFAMFRHAVANLPLPVLIRNVILLQPTEQLHAPLSTPQTERFYFPALIRMCGELAFG